MRETLVRPDKSSLKPTNGRHFPVYLFRGRTVRDRGRRNRPARHSLGPANLAIFMAIAIAGPFLLPALKGLRF
jgi:hypothetical protein